MYEVCTRFPKLNFFVLSYSFDTKYNALFFHYKGEYGTRKHILFGKNYSLFRWYLPSVSFITICCETKEMFIFKPTVYELNKCILSLYRGENTPQQYDRYGDDPSTSCSEMFFWHIEVIIDDTVLSPLIRYFSRM